MIEVNLPNIVTIAICGALGYALVIGLAKAGQSVGVGGSR